MTAQAQQIHLVLHQHALVRRAVRGVTDGAAFDDRFMLVDVRPLLLSVALKADRIARGVGAKLPGAEGAVWVVTVVALHQTFIHAVMKGPGELGANVAMAAVT